jgi:hypothetical protein
MERVRAVPRLCELYPCICLTTEEKARKKLSKDSRRVPAGTIKISRQSALENGKVVSPTHRPSLPPCNIPGTHFCLRLSQPQGRSATRRIMLMKNFNDNIRNRARDLPACSAVPQPTAPPRTSNINCYICKI